MNARFARKLLVAALFLGSAASAAEKKDVMLYIGTYTNTDSKGIYRLRMNPETGALSAPELAVETPEPSFLVLGPGGKHVYAVNETGDETGATKGGVSAFAIGPDGTLKLLNRQSSEGGAPCHLALDAKGRHLLVANYHTGNAAVLPIGADGTLGPATAVVQHKGKGPNAGRQQGPHAHAVTLDPADRFAWVTDLGIDQVVAYRLDLAKGGLAPHEEGTAKLAPGAGPRHFSFSPSGKHGYVLGELNSTVTAYGYDAARGALKELQTLSTLPADFKGENSTAEIAVRPDGRFVYSSNRGHDSISIFAVDEKAGTLKLVGHQSTLGKTPRHFTIDKTGTYLLAANQNSDSIVVFKIDAAKGTLTPVGKPVKVPRPVCILFAS